MAANLPHDRTRTPGAVPPTLFIGMGGTGRAVLLKVRRRLLAADWNGERLSSVREYPLASFLLFDVENEPSSLDQHDPLGEKVAFEEEERIGAISDLNKYCRDDGDLAKYPHIHSWFPMAPKKMREWIDESRDRANHHIPPRCFSRLAFFDRYFWIRATLQSKLQDLLRAKADGATIHRLGIKGDTQRLRIVIVCSAYGCTGSGVYLDMGWLSRWLSKKAFGSSAASTELFMTLPGGSGSPNREHEEALAYATLMELETVMRGGLNLVDRWDPYESPDLDDRPFNEVYLISDRNLAGVQAESPDALHEMLAGSFFEDFVPSDFSERKRAIRACHAQFKFYPYSPPLPERFGDMHLSYSKCYSALGYAEFVRPISSSDVSDQHQAQTTVEVLAGLPASERARVISTWLAQAMPWVDAGLSEDFQPSANAYMHLIGATQIADIRGFEEELSANLPSQAGLNSRPVQLVETCIPDRAVCYSELSGFPLTCLRQLPRWRSSYRRMAAQGYPLHIHRDTSQFVDPLAPTVAELTRLASDFQLFLQAIILGALMSRKGTNEYAVKKRGNRFSIGNERTVRLVGVASEHHADIEQQSADAMNKVSSPHQLAGLAVLYDYYAQEAYRPRIVKDETTCERLSESLGYVLCKQLHEQALKEFQDMSSVQKLDERAILDCLNSSLDAWTYVISGSEKDGYLNEVHEEHRAKRVVKQEFFEAGWLERLVAPSYPSEPLAADKPGAMPPPLPEQANLQCWIVIDGQRVGPLDTQALTTQMAGGTLTPQTLIWYQGLANWIPACQATNVAALFVQVPPPLLPL